MEKTRLEHVYLITLLSIKTCRFQNYANFIATNHIFKEPRTRVDGIYYSLMVLLNIPNTEGFTRLWPSVLVVLGYGVAFWGLSMVVKSMPLGIVYAIWSGMGIVLVSVAAVFVYQQKLDWPAIVGMGLIIAGVLVINLLSKASVH